MYLQDKITCDIFSKPQLDEQPTEELAKKPQHKQTNMEIFAALLISFGASLQGKLPSDTTEETSC